MRQKKSWLSQQYHGHLILLSLLVIVLVMVTTHLVERAYNLDRKIIQLNFIAVLLGLVLEYRRISEKWSTVLWTALGALVLSFVAFSKRENDHSYIFENQLEMWPYYFLGAFVLIATVVHYTTATKKLTEGITLLLSISINYWILANDYWHSDYFIVKCLIVLNLIFTAFSIFNSLSYKYLGRGSRLALSLWSSVITLILSIDNFLKIYKYRDIEHLPTFSESSFIFFQFFLLGISSIYIAQNVAMVSAYLPGKHYKDIGEINDIHIDRYSKEQVYFVDSLIVLIISLTGFVLNYLFQFLPANFMIWATITVAPLLLYLAHKMLR